MDEEQESVLLQIYTSCAAVVFVLMFINLGTLLDWKRLKFVLTHLVGPFLGFSSRFILLPAVSLALGRIFFRHNRELQLGLLITAISPSGGLANIFTIFLKGNIGLSLTMASFNSLLALGMLPLWMLVIVPAIYDGINITVPYLDLAVSAAIIILAIICGIVLRSCIPKTTLFVFRFLKPILLCLSFVLVALTVGLHFYVFKEINWRIAIAVILLPLIGYICVFGLSKLFCRSTTDALTISIETSVLNMTLPILLIRHGFAEDRLNSVIVMPIAASLASLCFALTFYAVRRIFGWNKRVDDDAFDENLLLMES